MTKPKRNLPSSGGSWEIDQDGKLVQQAAKPVEAGSKPSKKGEKQ